MRSKLFETFCYKSASFCELCVPLSVGLKDNQLWRYTNMWHLITCSAARSWDNDSEHVNALSDFSNFIKSSRVLDLIINFNHKRNKQNYQKKHEKSFCRVLSCVTLLSFSCRVQRHSEMMKIVHLGHNKRRRERLSEFVSLQNETQMTNRFLALDSFCARCY